jgi:hypothetical protein
LVGYQAAIAGKPAPTEKAKARRMLFTTQMAECQLAESF